jgi:hypothetical protein
VVAPAHSAAFSAAGYLHQLQVGLLALWDVAALPGSAVRVESLDDIDILDGEDAASLIQVKNQLGDAAMTDRSPALWRSLTVWMDFAGALGDEPLCDKRERRSGHWIVDQRTDRHGLKRLSLVEHRAEQDSVDAVAVGATLWIGPITGTVARQTGLLH